MPNEEELKVQWATNARGLFTRYFWYGVQDMIWASSPTARSTASSDAPKIIGIACFVRLRKVQYVIGSPASKV